MKYRGANSGIYEMLVKFIKIRNNKGSLFFSWFWDLSCPKIICAYVIQLDTEHVSLHNTTL